MEATLVMSALLMGLAGAPHCAVMCGPACAALTAPSARMPQLGGGWGGRAAGFLVARVFSYAAAGAFAAAGVAWMTTLPAVAPVLRPAWALLHVAAMTLGLWMCWTGQQPAWMSQFGRGREPGLPKSAVWVAVRGPGAAVSAGLAWIAWPCGLLHSALVVAGLANTPQGGASVMAAFAAASGMGLQAIPWAWTRWVSGSKGSARVAATAFRERLVRGAGALLVIGSAWALGQDVWGRVWKACFG